MCLFSHFHNLRNHIIVNRVIWLLTERQIYCVCERRLKYIELLKGLPAVHHCHLTHVECEVPSQQPLGGHLLPPLTNRATYTHTEWHPKFLPSKKRRMFTVAESNHSGTRVADNLYPNPQRQDYSDWDLSLLVKMNTCFSFTFLFFSFFKFTFSSHARSWEGSLIIILTLTAPITVQTRPRNSPSKILRTNFFDGDGFEFWRMATILRVHDNRTVTVTVVVMFMHF